MEILVNSQSGDQFDPWVESVNFLFGYSDNTLKFPEVNNIDKNDGINPEWFYDILAGTQDTSELNAIRLYRSNVNKLDDVATLFSGISFVEMQHYDHLQELILALGGEIDNIGYNNSELIINNQLSVDNRTALEVAIRSETDTIYSYQEIADKVLSTSKTYTRDIVMQVINKIIADEKKHIELFTKRLKEI